MLEITGVGVTGKSFNGTQFVVWSSSFSAEVRLKQMEVQTEQDSCNTKTGFRKGKTGRFAYNQKWCILRYLLTELRGNSHIFYFYPVIWTEDPIWLYFFFQMDASTTN